MKLLKFHSETEVNIDLMWIDFFSQEIKRKILLTSKSVNFWWDKNRKITFWVYHLHPALCASPPQIPILPQSNLPKRCYETHCIGNMHMVTYQTYLDAERPRKLPPLVQMLSTSDPTTLHHHCLVKLSQIHMQSTRRDQKADKHK